MVIINGCQKCELPSSKWTIHSTGPSWLCPICEKEKQIEKINKGYKISKERFENR